MTRPFFNKERITDFDIFDQHAHDAIEQAADRLAAGYPIDFQVELSFKIICSIALTADRIWYHVLHWIQPLNSYSAEMSARCLPAFATLPLLPLRTPLHS
jgi:hypothetical protein